MVLCTKGISENNHVEQRGRDYPVVALVDDTAKINDIEQVPGIAAKAGFTDVRTFIVKNKIGMMAEIKFFPAVPISKIPPSESICTSP